MKKIKLLDKDSMSKIIKRLAHEIVENNENHKKVAIVGIRTRGDVIAKRMWPGRRWGWESDIYTT